MTTSAMFVPPSGGVLVASASMSFREQVRHSLDDRRWPVQEVLGGAEALDKLESGDWQMLFLDRRLPDLDSEELIEIIRLRFPGIEVVLLDSDSGQALPLLGPSMKYDPCFGETLAANCSAAASSPARLSLLPPVVLPRKSSRCRG